MLNIFKTLSHYTVCNYKQGFVEPYTQRLIEGNIVKLKLFRLRPHRLRLSWLRPHMLTSHRLRLHRLFGSEAGGGRSNEIIYSSISRKKDNI